MRNILVISLGVLTCCSSCFIVHKRDVCRPDIVGTIVDSATSEPVVGGTILVEGTTLGAMTGPSGRYQLCNIPPGQYVLRCSSIGYLSAKQSVHVTADSTQLVVNFALVRDPDSNRQLRGVSGERL